jgi:Ni/Fe-hydrogenase 1 B-type cytochrome subunit
MNQVNDPPVSGYPAWDAGVRAFHWINLLCVLALIAVGLGILNDKALGLGNDAKVLLKTVHVWIGYVFVLNLIVRLAWAFFGGPLARWGNMLPGGRGYVKEMRAFLADRRARRPRPYLGHNPLGRISILLLLMLLLTQAISGLILAGTDLFMPPLGGWLASKIAAPGIDPATLVPYAPQMYDAAAYAAMRGWRGAVVEIHEIGFYGLMIAAVLHVVGVVVAEFRDGGSLVSAMITGRKMLRGPPVDRDQER